MQSHADRVQVERDNPHGTGWKPRITKADEYAPARRLFEPCECAPSKCTSDVFKACEGCGTYWCIWCKGFRAAEDWSSKEGYLATYLYNVETNRWELGAN